jgi:radical SAM superfamily enzyme YgiQ (UPF0313 family)
LKKGYDIVGISFFTWTVPNAVKMAEMAREYGVSEVWGGNYGVMTPEVCQYFDRVFLGNCEAHLKKEIEGKELSGLSHPIIIGKSNWAAFQENVGYLYNKRGCNAKCTFCPTPWFTSEDQISDILETEKVLDYYRKVSADPVIIFDETFLDNKDSSEMIIEELARRNLSWVCMTRADRIVGKVRRLKEKGLHSVIIGVESIRDKNLSFVSKKEKVELIKDVVIELGENDCFANGTYMIGFPGDTAETIKNDVDALASWGFFLIQFTVLTPYPGTPLWEQLKDKIIDVDWRHYDSYHLVWDHPHLKQKETRELLYYALRKINKPSNYLSRQTKRYLKQATSLYGQVLNIYSASLSIIFPTIRRYMSKLRSLLLVPSSSCGKNRLAVCLHVHRYGRRNNHAGPAKGWPEVACYGIHHRRPGPNS